MGGESKDGITYNCFMCPVSISSHTEWNAHIINHFQQTHCSSCNSDLICVGDVWYKPHANAVCDTIKVENDADVAFADPLQTIDPHDTEQTDDFAPVAKCHHEQREHSGDDAVEPSISVDDVTSERLEQDTANRAEAANTSAVRRTRRSSGKRIVRAKAKVSRFASAECPECKRKFNNKSSCKGHYYKYHHNGTGPDKLRQFMCDICGKTCVTKFVLKQHLNTHTGDKPFKCNYCDQAFSTKYTRNRHHNTHTGDKPCKCTADNCDRAFSQHIDLYRHLYKVHGIYKKKFPCTRCDKVFAEKSLLKKHDCGEERSRS